MEPILQYQKITVLKFLADYKIHVNLWCLLMEQDILRPFCVYIVQTRKEKGFSAYLAVSVSF